MRPFIFAAMLAFATPAIADEAAIRGVIDDQIAAFRADDVQGAFAYAAPTIQGIFGNPVTFGRMVQQGYPMVWRPAQVEYLGAEPRGPGWVQDVLITDGAGRIHKLRYTMVEMDGAWRIGGVEILAAPEVGA